MVIKKRVKIKTSDGKNIRKNEVKGFYKFVKIVFFSLWFLIKLPFVIIYKVISLIFRSNKEKENGKNGIKAIYEKFSIVKNIDGNFDSWENGVYNSDSKVGIIIGARGSGKSGIGVKMLENIYSLKKIKCYAIGFRQEDFPSWIKVVDKTSDIGNDSFVLIDEGGILFSSRNSMSNANKLLSELILIARHKNIKILFISQNSSNLDVNILRQADYLILKNSSLLQKDFERKIIQKIYDQTQKDFTKYKDDKGLAYIYSSDFSGFISNKLPSFWDKNISKSFR